MRTEFRDDLPGLDGSPTKILALESALEKLEGIDPAQVQVVELRLFAGLTVAETAEQMGLSERTVKRRWNSARVWLYKELE